MKALLDPLLDIMIMQEKVILDFIPIIRHIPDLPGDKEDDTENEKNKQYDRGHRCNNVGEP